MVVTKGQGQTLSNNLLNHDQSGLIFFEVWAHYFLWNAQNPEKILEKRYNLLPDNLNIQETFVSRRVFTTWTVIVIKICDIVHYS